MRLRIVMSLAVVALALYVLGAAAYARLNPTKTDRGIRFSHDLHTQTLELDCTDCHGFEANRFGLSETVIPGHNVCGVCHDLGSGALSQACNLCHTQTDPTIQLLIEKPRQEVRFDHNTHIAADVDCATCHEKPDTQRLAKIPLMNQCMNCHAKVNPALNECSVCHTEITRDTKPLFRGLARIAHDDPEVWERSHGHEYQRDPQFCATCHTDREASCEQCHRVEKPSTHTAAWNRRTHGLRATWNRAQCAVCHEENSCQKCHQNTQPASHRRGGFKGPADRHCVSCHFPQQQNNCSVCHERIDHRTANRSVHARGIFPPNCARCHPGGNPFRAPHPSNSTARCATCHQ